MSEFGTGSLRCKAARDRSICDRGLGFLPVSVLICGGLKQRFRKFNALVAGVTGQDEGGQAGWMYIAEMGEAQ